MGEEPIVDFEVAKIARVLAKRKGDGEVVVTRRGRAITVAVTRPPSGRLASVRSLIAQLRQERDGAFTLFWQRATGGWEEYGLAGTLDECLAEVRRDPYGCFWG